MDTSLPPLIQQMLRPGFYPHPVVEPIQLSQTHISYLLLTGDYAYKVKKPVNFGFLDFSTLERRRHFCQEELRLNRRLSPQLYLAVLPITAAKHSDHYQLAPKVDAKATENQGSNLPVVEYAVQMRQFPQDGLFSHLFKHGKLTATHMQTLGKQVAEFHSSAPTSAEIQQFGDVAAVRQVAEGNYATTLPYIGRAQTQAQFDQTHDFTEQFFADHRDWFHQRQVDGKIRECHGDLHLNNVCIYQDQIQIFDCIEFNQEFRNTDVIYDAAFMVMDLEFRDRADLANVFLNAYLEQTGDYWGAALLPLYLSMRAYVRAKVNSLTLDDSSISAAEKQQAQEQAVAYYQFAWAYTQPRQGQLVLMSGLSGSGKTTLARQIAPAIKAIHIRSDAVRKHLAGLALDQRGDVAGEHGSGIYTPEMTRQTYARLIELGIFLAQQGQAVILDAKYDQQEFRQAAIAQAQTHRVPLKIFYCAAPLEVLSDRVQSRTRDITDATAELLKAQQETTEPFTEEEQAYVQTIDTDQDLAAQVSEVVSQLPKN